MGGVDGRPAQEQAHDETKEPGTWQRAASGQGYRIGQYEQSSIGGSSGSGRVLGDYKTCRCSQEYTRTRTRAQLTNRDRVSTTKHEGSQPCKRKRPLPTSQG